MLTIPKRVTIDVNGTYALGDQLGTRRTVTDDLFDRSCVLQAVAFVDESNQKIPLWALPFIADSNQVADNAAWSPVAGDFSVRGLPFIEVAATDWVSFGASPTHAMTKPIILPIALRLPASKSLSFIHIAGGAGTFAADALTAILFFMQD